MNVIIAGGGIGGLVAAIALRRARCEVEVYEKVAAVDEVGAGLSLWANAIRVLDACGLGAGVRAIGMPAVGSLRRDDGAVLSQPSEALRRRFPDFCLVVHRADFQALLLRALPGSGVRCGAAVERFDEDAGGVTVWLSNGASARGDVLVGADGLRSVVRARLHGELLPSYAGYTAWRGVASFDHGVLRPGETWGRGRRFGQLALTDGRVYWYAAADAPEHGRSRGGEAAELLRLFRGWHAPIAGLIEALPEDRILRNDIYDRPPLAVWGRGRVTLLGDAAHPMTPNLGQGACQAIEDAIVLARHLSTTAAAPADRLRAYEAARAPRTSRLVIESRRVGAVAQFSQPLAVSARNWLVRTLGSRLQESNVAATIGYDATGD